MFSFCCRFVILKKKKSVPPLLSSIFPISFYFPYLRTSFFLLLSFRLQSVHFPSPILVTTETSGHNFLFFAPKSQLYSFSTLQRFFHPPRRTKNNVHLSEDERLFVVGGVQPVVHHHARAELLPDGVRRQPVHVHLHVRADFLVGQELAGENLRCGKRRSGIYGQFMN